MNFRIKNFLLLVLSSSFFILVGCDKEPQDRIGKINSMYKGTIDYDRAQQNLRYKEPYIINDDFQIRPSASVANAFSQINSDKTRSFSYGSPSDSSKLVIGDVDCQNYRSRFFGGDWNDVEPGKMGGTIAYTVCHLPASEFW